MGVEPTSLILIQSQAGPAERPTGVSPLEGAHSSVLQPGHTDHFSGEPARWTSRREAADAQLQNSPTALAKTPKTGGLEHLLASFAVSARVAEFSTDCISDGNPTVLVAIVKMRKEIAGENQMLRHRRCAL